MKKSKEGLIKKYIISHADGTVTDDDAKYFVLRYDAGGKDRRHIRACQVALLKYAEEIEDHLPILANDLRKQVASEILK